MAPSGSKKMKHLMIFFCFISIEIILVATSPPDIRTGNDQQMVVNSTRPIGNDKIFQDSSAGEYIRKSRTLPVSASRRTDNELVEELNTLEASSDNINPKLYLAKFFEEFSKRDNSAMIPTLRFGRSKNSMIPSLRFGKSGNSMIPSIRFGRSGNSMIPSIRFGRSGNSMIPSIRFGRSGKSMIPSIRFGRSGNSMIPSIRFGRSGNSMIPVIRFGRSYKNVGDEFLESNVSGENIEGEAQEKNTFNDDDDENYNSYISDSDESYKIVSALNTDINNRRSAKKRGINESGSLIPYPRFGREIGTDSKDTTDSLEFFNRILERSTNDSNDSIIPQIRYGRSSLKLKKTKEPKPPFFVLPNIRPGRSSSDSLDMKESTSEPYYADLEGFLGLFSAFRRSDGDSIDDATNMQEMELGSKGDDMLTESDQINFGPTNKELEEQFLNTNKDSLFVIPYPRPGKRQIGKVQTLEKGNTEYQDEDQSRLLQADKVSSYMLPYPRPGKRGGRNTENLVYTRSKRSNIPYPRPGRSYSIIPHPRLGRSDSILPYPRLGRSIPYPRPGRQSNSILPYPRLGRSSNVLPYPRPGRSSKQINFMLPYPNPDNSQQSLFYNNKNGERDGKNEYESPIEELNRSKRSTGYNNLDLISPMSKDIVEGMNLDLEQNVPSKGMSEDVYKTKVSEDLINLLLKNMKDSETDNKNSYILPYPRPGRDV